MAKVSGKVFVPDVSDVSGAGAHFEQPTQPTQPTQLTQPTPAGFLEKSFVSDYEAFFFMEPWRVYQNISKLACFLRYY